MISFLQIGCKITTFYGYGQIKCTKTAKMCTLRLFCAIINSFYLPLLNQISQDVTRQLLRDGTGGCTCGILSHAARG